MEWPLCLSCVLRTTRGSTKQSRTHFPWLSLTTFKFLDFSLISFKFSDLSLTTVKFPVSDYFHFLYFQILRLFHDYIEILWLFQVFLVGGHPEQVQSELAAAANTAGGTEVTHLGSHAMSRLDVVPQQLFEPQRKFPVLVSSPTHVVWQTTSLYG